MSLKPLTNLVHQSLCSLTLFDKPCSLTSVFQIVIWSNIKCQNFCTPTLLNQHLICMASTQQVSLCLGVILINFNRYIQTVKHLLSHSIEIMHHNLNVGELLLQFMVILKLLTMRVFMHLKTFHHHHHVPCHKSGWSWLTISHDQQGLSVISDIYTMMVSPSVSLSVV